MSTNPSRRAARLLALGVTAVITAVVWPGPAAADSRGAQEGSGAATTGAIGPFVLGSQTSPFINIAVSGGSTAIGARIVVHDTLAHGRPTDGRDKWLRLTQPDGTFLLQNLKSMHCVQAGLIDATLLVQMPCTSSGSPLIFQKWRKVGVDPVRPRANRITRSIASGWTWDLENTTHGSTVVHGPVQPGKPSQTFLMS